MSTASTDGTATEIPHARPALQVQAPAGDETTRRLCAAAQVDTGFSRKVLEEVVDQPHRAVAPSYGIDIVPVVRHALAARHRVLLRDVALTTLVVVSLVLSFENTLMTLVLLAALALMIRGVGRLVVGNLIGAVAWTVAGVVVAAVPLGVPELVTVLSSGTVPLDSSAAPSLVIAIRLVVCAWGVLWIERAITHQVVSRELQPDHFTPDDAPAEPAGLRGRIDYLASSQRGNVTVYSQTVGRQFPFVGSGPVIDSWSIASPLVVAEDGDAPATSLSASDFYEAMRRSLVSLASPALRDDLRIAGLSLQDRLLVGGFLTRGSPFVDHERRRPVFRVPPETIRAVAGSPRGHERHYLTIRVASWGGEVEVTCFMFVSLRGGMLFLEFVATALPGIHWKYHAIDSRAQLNFASLVGAAARSLVDAPGSLLRAPTALVTDFGESVTTWYRAWRESLSIGHRIAWDYGATTSVRELAAAPIDEVFFQRLDSEQHVRIVARQVVVAIIETLGRFGYDTSDFDHRANTAIDNSVTIVDSTVSKTAFATGKGSKARVKSKVGRARRDAG